MQNVATNQSYNLLIMVKIVSANGTSAVVAVELNSCLSWKLVWGISPRMLFFTFMSLSVGIDPVPSLLLIDGVQGASHVVHVVYGPLLSMVQGRGDLGLLVSGNGELSVVLPRRTMLKVYRDSRCWLS